MAVAQRGRPTRKDTWRISVTIDGEDWGVWDTKTGGEHTSTPASPFRPGGMSPPIAIGGTASTGNVTLTRLCTLEDDWARLDRLINAAGRKSAQVKQVALDTDGNAYRNPLVYDGILMRVLPPEHDSNSTDPAMIEIEIEPSGFPVILP